MTETGTELNLKPIYRFLEVTFWIISVILVGLTVGAISYQLVTLFVPYWFSRGPFTFPHYFYRVYGDKVSELCSEHYGYLISAILVSAGSGYQLLTRHPWKFSTKPKSD